MPDRLARTRRGVLSAGLGAAAGLGLPRPAGAALPAAATLLVPGPEEGPFAGFAERLGGFLGRSGPTAIRLRQAVLGGPDGVTAANRFAVEGAPDGRTLLLLSGPAPLARLVGETRARFEVAAWLPVSAIRASAVVAGRQPLPPPGSMPRFGFAAPEGAGAAALLGLDLLGLAASPVLGLPAARAEAALGAGIVDAVLLQGGDLPARLAALGAQPWFALEAAGARDPALPEVPSLLDLAPGGPADLRGGFAAAAASARLQAALMLPALTPADLVAAWRAATQRWQEEEARAGWGPALRALSGAEAAPLVAALAPPPAASLAYREWLLRRLNWRPD